MLHLTTQLSVLLAALMALVAPTTPVAAQSYIYQTKYCAREYDGATSCSYYTLWQCQLAVSATGGDCAVNPRYAGDPPPRYRKAKRTIR